MNRNSIKLIVLVTALGMLAAFLRNVHPTIKIFDYEASSMLTIYPAVVTVAIVLVFGAKKKQR